MVTQSVIQLNTIHNLATALVTCDFWTPVESLSVSNRLSPCSIKRDERSVVSLKQSAQVSFLKLIGTGCPVTHRKFVNQLQEEEIQRV